MNCAATVNLREAAQRRGLKLRHVGPCFILETSKGTQVMRGTRDTLRAWCMVQPTMTQVSRLSNDDDAFAALRRKARRHGMRLKRRVAGSCQVFELSIDGVRVLKNCSQSELLEFIGALR